MTPLPPAGMHFTRILRGGSFVDVQWVHSVAARRVIAPMQAHRHRPAPVQDVERHPVSFYRPLLPLPAGILYVEDSVPVVIRSSEPGPAFIHAADLYLLPEQA